MAARDITLFRARSAARLAPVRHEGAFRHGGRCGAYRGCGEARVSRIRRRRTSTTRRGSPTISTMSTSSSAPMVCRDIADNFDMDINTLYACLRRHDQACRHQLLRPVACRGLLRSAAHDRGRRGAMAGAALRLELELLRRAADEVRGGKLHHDGALRARRACRCCCCRPGRPAQPRPRRLRPPSCRRWPSASPASSMSMRCSRAFRRSSAPGRSFPTCAPARCRAVRASRRC